MALLPNTQVKIVYREKPKLTYLASDGSYWYLPEDGPAIRIV